MRAGVGSGMCASAPAAEPADASERPSEQPDGRRPAYASGPRNRSPPLIETSERGPPRPRRSPPLSRDRASAMSPAVPFSDHEDAWRMRPVLRRLGCPAALVAFECPRKRAARRACRLRVSAEAGCPRRRASAVDEGGGRFGDVRECSGGGADGCQRAPKRATGRPQAGPCERSPQPIPAAHRNQRARPPRPRRSPPRGRAEPRPRRTAPRRATAPRPRRARPRP